ncbi:hypothetical protein V0288_05245 [Pannus brasiliensis CCIBt3594]|uniref:Uncharacterized protein n=1 Tax=Pannus brasiliensis CCIBt3594 TaxID=1427578 RepID=A0AAW9QFD9_9CHRO
MTPEERIEQLERELETARAENAALRRKLARAKDASPVERPSFKRVKQMASLACCILERVGGKVQARMGDKVRIFKKLRDAWEFFLQEEWSLSDLFPPPKPKPVRKPAEKPRCKFCDAEIHWSQDFMGKFRPYDAPGKRHQCAEYYRANGKPIPILMQDLVPF